MSFGPQGMTVLFYKVVCSLFVVATAVYSLVAAQDKRGYWFWWKQWTTRTRRY